MAKLSDLKFTYRIFMEAYPYRKINWRPGARLAKPLSECRLAVVTTSALYAPGQPPFDESIKGGDYSYRILPASTEVSTLRNAHRSDSFDHTGIETDPGIAFPLNQLRDLAAEAIIGGLAPRHFSFMGSITAPSRLISQTAPEAAALLREDGVDAVLLTPV